MIEDTGCILPLGQVRALVDKLAGRIDAPAHVLPTYGSTEDGARPHIECDNAYHWVVVERGEEIKRRSTHEIHRLLYWIFASATFDMASDFEARHRHPSDDFRRLLFHTQLQLLAKLDERWRVSRKEDLASVLINHPFEDGGPQDIT